VGVEWAKVLALERVLVLEGALAPERVPVPGLVRALVPGQALVPERAPVLHRQANSQPTSVTTELTVFPFSLFASFKILKTHGLLILNQHFYITPPPF